MASSSSYQRFLDLTWRRTLTEAEQAELRDWLAAHPDVQPDWEAEAALSDALRRVPDALISSNFTSRVLQAIERADARETVAPRPWPAWRLVLRWLPRTALAMVVVAAGLFSYHQTRAFRRAELVYGVSAVSDISSLPSPAILQDFDAIYALNQAPKPDEDLLKLMQ